jgi:hypothetical protein
MWNIADNGTYTGRADCNAISGTYTTGRNNAITIVAGASTLVACPGDSYGPLFAHAITTATSYAIANGELTLTDNEGGTMTFVAGSAAAVVVPTPTPRRRDAVADGLLAAPRVTTSPPRRGADADRGVADPGAYAGPDAYRGTDPAVPERQPTAKPTATPAPSAYLPQHPPAPTPEADTGTHPQATPRAHAGPGT